jgi:hypothetical protein
MLGDAVLPIWAKQCRVGAKSCHIGIASRMECGDSHSCVLNKATTQRIKFCCMGMHAL